MSQSRPLAFRNNLPNWTGEIERFETLTLGGSPRAGTPIQKNDGKRTNRDILAVMSETTMVPLHQVNVILRPGRL